MPVIIPVDYCQANVVLSLGGDSEPIVNTFGLRLTDASNLSTATADAVMLEYGAAFTGAINLAYTLQQVVLYGFNGLGPSEIAVSSEDPVPMTGTGGALPQNCAILIRKRTDTAGRRGRGRMYLPGVPEIQVGPTGVLETQFQTNVQGLANDFLSGLQATVGIEDMVVLHRSEGIGDEPPPTVVTSLQVDSRIATQRRRLRP